MIDIKILQKKNQHHRECNKNLSEEQKQKVVEYRKNYHIMHNKELLGQVVDFSKIIGLLKRS